MPHRSPYPDIEIPDLDIWSLLFERQDRPYSDDKILFHDVNSARKYSYQDLRQTTIAFGQGLRDTWSWKKGGVLAIYSANDVDYAAVSLGCHWAGGVVTTVSPAYTIDELVAQLRDSDARGIVTQESSLSKAQAAAKEVGIPENRIVVMGQGSSIAGVKHFTALRGSSQRKQRPFAIDPRDDLAFLVYSSGTTGAPKGVMLSHRNIVSNVLQGVRSMGDNLSCGDGTTGSGDRVLAMLPFYHIYGLTVLLHFGTYHGLESFVMPQFELRQFCETIQRHKVTYANIVPRVAVALAKVPIVGEYDLSSVRMLVSAAAPLSKELVELVYKRLGIPVKQAFGTSETSPGVTQQGWDDWKTGIGSVGRLMPNIEGKVVDIETSQELAANNVGELWFRGPNIFKGYLNNDAATTSALTADGWYKSGDVGYADETGRFFITDRIKELIKYNGFQVAPAQLEGVLLKHPKVKDAAVIGLFSNERQTELPRAYIVLDGDASRSTENAEEIADWLRARVAGHKRLRGGVRFIDAIPVSAAGKMLRRELKAMAQAEEQQARSK
ncbi:hypothetical protein DOTSEDRAFT_161744, partial [Dothistroma septosporum NZE10]